MSRANKTHARSMAYVQKNVIELIVGEKTCSLLVVFFFDYIGNVIVIYFFISRAIILTLIINYSSSKIGLIIKRA